MIRDTRFLVFWRALGPRVPLGLAARAYAVTRCPAEAFWMTAPSRHGAK